MSSNRLRRRVAGALAGGLLAALVTVVAPAAATAAAAPDAAGCSLASTGSASTIRFANGRFYRVYVPPGLTEPAPLILSLHGAGEPALVHEVNTGWDAFARDHGAIVAYPQGILFFWNFLTEDSGDVQYIRNVIADVSGKWCVDPDRIHAEGYSNGGSMTNRLACDANDVIASFTSYAGSSATALGGPCNPDRPISIGIFTSLVDPIIVFGLQDRAYWTQKLHCPPGVTEPNPHGEVLHYSPCDGGTEVLWRVYNLNSHNWPVLPEHRADILQRMWDLFEANPMS